MTTSVETKVLWLYITPFIARILQARIGTPLDVVDEGKISIHRKG